MPPSSPLLEVFGPVAYSPLWLALAIAAVALAIGLPLAVWRFGRRPAAAAAVAPLPVAPSDPEAGRGEALDRIAAARRDLASGSITPRAASQLLSRVVRDFLATRGHGDVEAMTLSELRAAPGLAPVAEFMAELYPPSFGPGGPTRGGASTVDEAAARAEALVASWR